ncbi:MAG: cyclase family protein [Neglectibacter sp.]
MAVWCNLKMEVKRFHANDGMYNIQWEGIMHRGTHMDAPLHVTECTPDITQYPVAVLRRGVCLDIPKGKWGKSPQRIWKMRSPKFGLGILL